MSDFVDGLRATAAAALFPTEGELTVPGLVGPVAVGRDAWGVPYLEAEHLEDLWFAQGFVTAGERLFQLDLLLRAATGRLSEVFADRTLADDRFARTVGLHRAGVRIAARWDDADRAMHSRFREGVAAWVAQMPAPPLEYVLLDLAPAIPDDDASWAAAFAFLAWGLSGNWDRELLRAWIDDRAGEEAARMLMPPLPADPPAVAAGALHGAIFDALPRHEGQGSNDWVVAPSRTVTGGALLANDPHLLALQPGAWIEMHLSAPGYRARGVALTFSPGILLGTTDHHAWGVTNVSGDVQDLFVERLDAERTAAEFEGAWAPLTIHRETIAVRGSDPHVLEVRETRHGPLLDTFPSGVLDVEHVAIPPEESYALRWVGADAAIRPSLTLEAARAASFEGFRDAVLGLECPGQNFVYADVEGTIGFVCTGRFPVRRRGDGTAPVPGWTGEHEWDGWIPPDELPWAKDPARGFLATANHRIHDAGYPHLIGNDFHPPFRARRIVEVLEANDRCSVEDMVRLQMDTVSIPARELLPSLLRIAPEGEERRAAMTRLRGWDADMAAESHEAALFTAWCRHIARRALEPRLGADLFRHYHAWREPFQCQALPALLTEPDGWLDDGLLRAALDDALDEVREPDGGARTWGAMHRLRLAHPLAAIPGLEPLFLAADVELAGDEQTVMQAGFDGRDGYPAAVVPSWRAVYDLADLDRSVGVLPTGISGNPASPHWNDQTAAWVSGATHPLPFSPAAVAAATVGRVRLLPG